MKIKRFFVLCCFSLIFAFICVGQIHAQAPKTAKIVFASSLNVKAKDKSDIYIMNPDGTGRVNLTRHNAKDSEPTWSPSGRHILFTSDRDGGNDIYRMNADGTNVRRIFKKWADRSNPVWSPEGRQIAYFREDEQAIYIADIDGANEKRLVNGWHPTWSPDGTEIAFVSLAEGFGIHVIDLKTGVERVLVPMEGEFLHEPVWSPDGTKIAFNRVNFLLLIFKVLFNAKDNQPTQTIDTVNSDGREIRSIVGDESQVSDPAWSPHSDALIYSQLSGKERHLFKISLGNRVSEQITHVGSNYSSDWFDPAILSVEPHPQLHLATWSKIKTKTD